MAITIEMLLKNFGVIQSAKEAGAAVGEVADTFDDLGDASLDATDRAKLALRELYQKQLEQARQSTQVYSDMTREQRDEYRARFENEEDWYRDSQELWKKREAAERDVLDRFREEYKRTFESVDRMAEDSSKKVGDSTERGFERAGDAAKDAGDTVTDTVGDALGSLDGTAQGAADGAMGALRGLAGLIPGVGAAIGAGLATIGSLFVRQFFQDIEEAEQRIDKMAEHFINSTTRMLSERALIDIYEEWFNDDDMRERAQSVADALGLPMERVLADIVANGQASQDMIDELDARLQEGVDAGLSRNLLEPLRSARQALVDTQTEWEKAEQQADSYRRGLDYLVNPIDEATAAAAETNAELDRLTNPRAAEIMLNVDTSEAEREVQRFLQAPRRLKVNIEGVTRDGRVVI